MRRTTAICLAVFAASLAAVDPAPVWAQTALPPYEVVTIVRSTGLEPVSRPLRRGQTYILQALDGYNEEVTVTVDARRGRILSVRPVVTVAAPYARPPDGYALPERGYPAYAPPPYYPDDEFEFGAPYQDMPSGPPRVIYGQPDRVSPPKSAKSPAKKAAAAKSVPAAPADSSPQAADVPPVQILE